MTKWNWEAMGQVGLTGWARRAARPVAEMLSLIGAGFLAISLVDFLRQVNAVIAAGRPAPQLARDVPAARHPGRPRRSRHRPAGSAAPVTATTATTTAKTTRRGP